MQAIYRLFTNASSLSMSSLPVGNDVLPFVLSLVFCKASQNAFIPFFLHHTSTG